MLSRGNANPLVPAVQGVRHRIAGLRCSGSCERVRRIGEIHCMWRSWIGRCHWCARYGISQFSHARSNRSGTSVDLDIKSAIAEFGPHDAFSVLRADQDVVVLTGYLKSMADLAPTEQSGAHQMTTIQNVVELCRDDSSVR